MPFLRFLSVLGAVLFGWHAYLWMRLVRDPAWPEPWASLAGLAIAVLGLSIFGGFFLRRVLRRRLADVVQTAIYSWMGFGFLLLVMLAASDLAWMLVEGAAYAGVFDPPVASDPASARLIAGGATVLAALLSGLALLHGRASSVRTERISVSVAKLRDRPYRIAQISDLHVGATIRRDYVESVVARVNALDADLVVLTGDVVDGSVAELASEAEPLGRLRAREGVFLVTGNHEYYAGVHEWLDWYREHGIRVLGNERVSVGGEDGFDLAGVDDWMGRGLSEQPGSELRRALAGRDERRALVLLAHRPRTIDEAARRGVDLQLSGHTHGGQLYPFHWLVRLFEPYVAGLYRVGAAHLYVSRGTGHWGPPMRLGSRAEVTLIEMAPAAG